MDVKPTETTANHHRFEVKLAANANEKFVVREEHLLENSEQISNLNDDQILIYVRNKSLSDAARRQLDQVRAKKAELQEANQQVARQTTEINELVQDQERVRQNLNSLNRINGQEAQVRKYASDLAASEARLATLRDALRHGTARLGRRIPAEADVAERIRQWLEALGDHLVIANRPNAGGADSRQR